MLEPLSRGLSETGLNGLDSAGSLANKVAGADLSSQLFDVFAPLERWTEYQRSYNWEIVFPFKMGRIPGPIISKYCKAVGFGDYHFKEVNEVQKGAKSFFTPGTLSIDTVTMVFLVSTPNLLQGYFQNWKGLVVDDFGHYSEQNVYKRPIYVRLYTTQGITAGTIKMIGSFPTSFYKYELSYETEDIVRYTITFSIDDIKFTGMDIGSSLPRVLRTVI